MRLGICSRSGDILEPMITPQWYVNCDSMAKRSTDAVRNGDLKILPVEEEKSTPHNAITMNSGRRNSSFNIFLCLSCIINLLGKSFGEANVCGFMICIIYSTEDSRASVSTTA